MSPPEDQLDRILQESESKAEVAETTKDLETDKSTTTPVRVSVNMFSQNYKTTDERTTIRDPNDRQDR